MKMKQDMLTKREEDDGKYQSRLLACTRCGSEQETKEKQLKISVGFRAIQCRSCGKQERVHSNKYSCNVIWHQRPVHRVDPTFDNARKTTKRKKEDERQTGKNKT